MLGEYKREFGIAYGQHRSDACRQRSIVQGAREEFFDLFFCNADVLQDVLCDLSLVMDDLSLQFAGDMLGAQYCSRCGDKTDGDIRYLRLSCLYELFESDIHGLRVADPLSHIGGYTIGVCKGCRAEWITSLTRWFKTPRSPDIDSDGIRSCSVGTPEYEAFIAEWKAAANR